MHHQVVRYDALECSGGQPIRFDMRRRRLRPARAAPAASQQAELRSAAPAEAGVYEGYNQLLLPASAQRLVELNERQQLITSGLGKTEFGAEQVAIRIQRVQQCVDTAAVP